MVQRAVSSPLDADHDYRLIGHPCAAFFVQRRRDSLESLTILWIAIPLFVQTNLIFWLGYGLARLLRLSYEDAAPTAMIGASNHFEVAIATATMLFGLSSGAALATVVGVLIEVPVMLVKICLASRHWFAAQGGTGRQS